MSDELQRCKDARVDAKALQRCGRLRRLVLTEDRLQALVRDLGALPGGVVVLVDLAWQKRDSEVVLLHCRGGWVRDHLQLQGGGAQQDVEAGGDVA